jgi:competence protein CoiA
MLCAKRKSDGQIVSAYMASKMDAPFLCPECGDVVVLKIGRSKVNHFAHDNPLVCRYTTNESDAHRQCKFEIYQALLRHPNVAEAAMERPLGTNRPDVSAYINGVPVAIEVQISFLSQETIMRRTIEYARKGIYVLWLLLWTPDLDSPRYNPAIWEKWIHAAYFGRVYYWREGLSVVCYNFEPTLKSVPMTTWYSASGRKMTGGGYTRRMKRHRTAIRGDMLNLATDFVPQQRYWWEGNGIKVPDAKLFMHRSVSKKLRS